MSSNVSYTYYSSYLTFQLNALKNLLLDFLSICRNCWFWDIYVLQGKVATTIGVVCMPQMGNFLRSLLVKNVKIT